MRIIATIEARMSSSRLPGKPLLKAAGSTMLEHLVGRLKAVSSIDGVVLATTSNAADDPLAELAKSIGIGVFRGSEHDVLNRVIGAASSAGAEVVVEITGDCPIIDPDLVEQTIQMFKAHDVDYVSNCHVRSFPDGMDVQVMLLDTLKRSAAMTDSALDLEHVTLHIRNNPKLFSRVNLVAPPNLWWPELGLTLDEQSDYELISAVIDFFESKNRMFSCLDAINYLKDNPSLLDLNKDILRKGDS